MPARSVRPRARRVHRQADERRPQNAVGRISAALFGVLAWHGAQAANIDIVAGDAGVLTPSFGLASVLGFDDLAIGGLPSYQFSGGSLTGSGAIENTSLVNRYAIPADDSTPYLTVSYPDESGSVQFFFDLPENYFGLYWGSIDAYNSISFSNDGAQIATFSGSDIVSIAGLVADGNQHLASSNRYINFFTNSSFFNEVVLSTSGFGFEVDNIAFADPPIDQSQPVPAPGGLPLLAFSLSMLAIVRRRGQRPIGS